MNLAPLLAGVLGPLYDHLRSCEACQTHRALCADGQRIAEQAAGRVALRPDAVIRELVPRTLRALADELEAPPK